MKAGSAMRPVRVALADDHAVVRAGYRRLLELEADLVVVAEYGDADSAYEALAGPAGDDTDLLVLDLSMPGRSGLDMLQRLARRRPALKLLVFTMHDSTALLEQCLRAGATGYVTKSSEPQVLVDALHRAARGETVLSPDVAARREAGPAPHTRLSSREFDVFQQLLAGRSIDSIATGLRVSTKTVANTQTRIRQVLGVTGALGLMHYAREHGLPDTGRLPTAGDLP
jgi:DNA-binding NarL/FixJ family response regulator